MDILTILKIIVAVATILTGLIAFLRPRSVTSFTGLAMPGPRGLSEVRAILGGLLIGLGLAPLVDGTPATYHMLGIGYAAIGLARLFSIVVDRSYERSNLISLLVEAVFAAILLIG
jgi:Domain of unknown function (DUF4345)